MLQRSGTLILLAQCRRPYCVDWLPDRRMLTKEQRTIIEENIKAHSILELRSTHKTHRQAQKLDFDDGFKCKQMADSRSSLWYTHNHTCKSMHEYVLCYSRTRWLQWDKKYVEIWHNVLVYTAQRDSVENNRALARADPASKYSKPYLSQHKLEAKPQKYLT